MTKRMTYLNLSLLLFNGLFAAYVIHQNGIRMAIPPVILFNLFMAYVIKRQAQEGNTDD